MIWSELMSARQVLTMAERGATLAVGWDVPRSGRSYVDGSDGVYDGEAGSAGAASGCGTAARAAVARRGARVCVLRRLRRAVSAVLGMSAGRDASHGAPTAHTDMRVTTYGGMHTAVDTGMHNAAVDT